MKAICIIGHFGFGKEMLDGQTVKTKTVTAELERQLGADQIVKIDTHGGARVLPRVILQAYKGFRHCKNIIIFPAQNGIRVFAPLCAVLNRHFHRKLHYVVIGGWLAEFLKEHGRLKKALKQFSGIYVETNTMKQALKRHGLTNTVVMPNFKDIRVLSESELVYSEGEPYRLCTFSRVMQEKGIDYAVQAVKAVNASCERAVFKLDIYGQVDANQVQWFEELKSGFTGDIQYCGLVPFDKSAEVLKSYHALLFPTYYEGEGFAGTLLDAMAAGVPVIASDWKYNAEIIIPNKTGILVEAKDQAALNRALECCNSTDWNQMKRACIEEAKKYTPENVIQVLIKRL